MLIILVVLSKPSNKLSYDKSKDKTCELEYLQTYFVGALDSNDWELYTFFSSYFYLRLLPDLGFAVVCVRDLSRFFDWWPVSSQMLSNLSMMSLLLTCSSIVSSISSGMLFM